MPGQNPVVAEHYPDHFHTVSFPLHGSTIGRNLLTPLLYVEKRQIVIDDVRLITRRPGAAGLTIDVGFTPGAFPVATWKGAFSITNTSATIGVASTDSGYSASSIGLGDRIFVIAGGVPTGFPADAHISTIVTAGSSFTMSAAATATSTSTTAYAVSYKSVLTAPMAAATENTMVVGAINSNLATIPTAAPNNLEVTTPNNVVPGPTTSGSTTTLGHVICIEARGAATTDYVGTLQIRYRERLA